jgi:apolipoprotein N-acyltransferase
VNGRSPRGLLMEGLLVAVAAGAHAVSLSGGCRLWPLQLAAQALLWGCLARAPVRRAAWLAGLFSTLSLGGSVWWLFVSLHRYGGLPAALAVVAVVLLCVFLSLYMAAAGAAFARLRRGRPVADALLAAALWLLAELARGLLFTGFPWAAGGYAHVDGPLAGLAPWIGVYGIGAVAAGLAALFALSLRRRPWRAAGAVLAVLLLAWGCDRDFTRPTGRLQVSLLQGNVPQDEKFVEEKLPQTLAWDAWALTTSPGDLVVAPETAVPLLPEQLPDGYWQALQGHFAGGDQAALVGLPLGSFDAGYTNSVAGLSRAALAEPGGFYRYDKSHLVPFGEFVPTGFHWFVAMMNIPLGDFNRGPLNAPSFDVRGERVAPNICYEDLFGEELAQRFVDAASAPTVLANVSNIGWFGDTVAIPQHLQISRLRSLELQRPMLRATNTGATAIIDHRGRVTAQLAPFTQGVLQGEVQGREGVTPFAWWAGRFGLWPLIGLGWLGVLGCRWWPGARQPHL